MNEYSYTLVEENEDEFYNIESQYCYEFMSDGLYVELVAETAAKHYYDKSQPDMNDPDSWPLTFKIYSRDRRQCFGTVSVSLDYEPVFHTREINEL